MKGLKVGRNIRVPCTVQPGPFSEERLVSFDTVDGPVTGFVREEDVKQLGGDQWFIKATVLSFDKDIVEVRVDGSFFTTNGIATISRGMALAA